MVNDENLIPINQRTKSEQREIQKRAVLLLAKRDGNKQIYAEPFKRYFVLK